MFEIIEELKSKEEWDLAWKLEDWLEQCKNISILDVECFKRELDRQGLKTKELEEFIENYMRFDNILK